MTTPINQSVIKAFELLLIVCARHPSPSLREVASEAEMSLATTHRILSTLKMVGALRSNSDGTYELGRTLAELSLRRSKMDADLKRILADHLTEQANAMRGSAHIAILDSESMVRFIARAEPGGGATVFGRIGLTYEAYFMASGKVLLAGLRRSRLSSYLLAGPFIAVTRNTITNPQRLADELARILIEGYAIDDEEFIEGMRSIAVPLRDEAGEVIAALSLSATRSGLSPSCTRAIADELKAAASRLRERLRELPWGVRALLCQSSDHDDDTLSAHAKARPERALC